MLVLEGSGEIVTKAARLTVQRGESVILLHDDGPFDVQGEGCVAIGAVPP